MNTKYKQPIDYFMESIKDPHNFVQLFNGYDDFEKWCNEGSAKDLVYVLRIFKNTSLTVYYHIILNVLVDKSDELL